MKGGIKPRREAKRQPTADISEKSFNRFADKEEEGKGALLKEDNSELLLV